MRGNHASEVKHGQRFEFGANWSRFLTVLDNERVKQAEASLQSMLGNIDLHGKTFLDIGSGSGLFSLAARLMGAKVHSFDYDPQSVACTREIRQRFFPDDKQWLVEQGSVLDRDYLRSLGQFDVVYSWGVLHHTGAMWEALENVAPLVAVRGRLFIAIYNDQGGWSHRWHTIKKVYNSIPSFLQVPFALVVMGPRELKIFTMYCLRGRPDKYFKYISNYAKFSLRGMSYWHDVIDWVGGYPFEVAKPEAIFDYYREKGFRLDTLKTEGGGLGCNEYIFTKESC